MKKISLKILKNCLVKGENSGFAKDFNRKIFLNSLHKKHLK